MFGLITKGSELLSGQDDWTEYGEYSTPSEATAAGLDSLRKGYVSHVYVFDLGGDSLPGDITVDEVAERYDVKLVAEKEFESSEDDFSEEMRRELQREAGMLHGADAYNDYEGCRVPF